MTCSADCSRGIYAKVDVARIHRTSSDKCYRVVTKYESKDSYPYHVTMNG